MFLGDTTSLLPEPLLLAVASLQATQVTFRGVVLFPTRRNQKQPFDLLGGSFLHSTSQALYSFDMLCFELHILPAWTRQGRMLHDIHLCWN